MCLLMIAGNSLGSRGCKVSLGSVGCAATSGGHGLGQRGEIRNTCLTGTSVLHLVHKYDFKSLKSP